MSTRSYDYGRQAGEFDGVGADDDYVGYQNHDFGGGGGFSFGGVKAERVESSDDSEEESEEESEDESVGNGIGGLHIS